MKLLLILIFAYLFGSIPWALIIGKVFYHTDIRTKGSGNLGGTNAGRVLGKKAGVTVIALDALKAFFTMVIANKLVPDAMLLAGLACCFGHCFPIFANFKGGKAVATSFGYLLGISLFITHDVLFQFIGPVLVFFIVLYLGKMVSLASLVSLAAAWLISLFTAGSMMVTLSLFLLWCFVTYRHKANIERIRNHEEKKITWM